MCPLVPTNLSCSQNPITPSSHCKMCPHVAHHLICCLLFEVTCLWHKVRTGVESSSQQVITKCSKHAGPSTSSLNSPNKNRVNHPHFIDVKSNSLRSQVTHPGSHNPSTEIWIWVQWWQSWISYQPCLQLQLQNEWLTSALLNSVTCRSWCHQISVSPPPSGPGNDSIIDFDCLEMEGLLAGGRGKTLIHSRSEQAWMGQVVTAIIMSS